MSKARDTKPNDEFQLMRQIFDNLLYLDYETGFDPVRRHLPYLNPLYFALPGQSLKEQFDYFAHLCVWLMQTVLGSEIETPSEYDEPPTVAENFVLAMPGIGFKLSFSSAKLVPERARGLHDSRCAAVAVAEQAALRPQRLLRGERPRR
jgi:hypothetical protein